jgi:hypothetical protein
MSSPAASAASPPPLFSVWNTNLAAYLVATGRLRYYDAVVINARQAVELRLEDPESIGPVLERAFVNRTAVVEPRSLFDAVKFLRSEVARAQRQAEFGNVEPIPVR